MPALKVTSQRRKKSRRLSPCTGSFTKDITTPVTLSPTPIGAMAAGSITVTRLSGKRLATAIAAIHPAVPPPATTMSFIGESILPVQVARPRPRGGPDGGQRLGHADAGGG